MSDLFSIKLTAIGPEASSLILKLRTRISPAPLANGLAEACEVLRKPKPVLTTGLPQDVVSEPALAAVESGSNCSGSKPNDRSKAEMEDGESVLIETARLISSPTLALIGEVIVIVVFLTVVDALLRWLLRLQRSIVDFFNSAASLCAFFVGRTTCHDGVMQCFMQALHNYGGSGLVGVVSNRERVHLKPHHLLLDA